MIKPKRTPRVFYLSDAEFKAFDKVVKTNYTDKSKQLRKWINESSTQIKESALSK